MGSVEAVMKKAFLKVWRRKKLCLGLVLLGAVSIVFCDQYVARASNGRVYRSVDDVPHREVALVLGTAKYVQGGRLNLFYRPRIEAAAELFKAGKVRGIVVSGDNGRVDYDEPSQMKSDLIALGVPAPYVTCDYAGFRTLDSVYRLERVFEQTSYVVVSQDFHVRRAIFLGESRGHRAVGLAADGPSGYWGARVRLREVLARCNAFLDVYLLRTQPRFLGRLEPVGKRPV